MHVSREILEMLCLDDMCENGVYFKYYMIFFFISPNR